MILSFLSLSRLFLSLSLPLLSLFFFLLQSLFFSLLLNQCFFHSYPSLVYPSPYLYLFFLSLSVAHPFLHVKATFADYDSKDAKLDTAEVDPVEVSEPVSVESSDVVDMDETNDEGKTQTEEILEKGSLVKSEESGDSQADACIDPDDLMPSSLHSIMVEDTNRAQKLLLPTESVILENDENTERVEEERQINDSAHS